MFSSALVLIASLVILTIGADLLVRGSLVIAMRTKVSRAFIGLTIIGFGTSTPELFTSVLAGWNGLEDIAVGNVVGSNTFNIAMILGLTAIVHPITVSDRFVRREVWLLLAVAWIPFVTVFTHGHLGRIAGTTMLLGLLAYLSWALRATGGAVTTPEPDRPRTPRTGLLLCTTQVGGGLALLIGGSHFLVTAATDIATGLGLSQLVIGLTIVAAGTSAPELVTSLVAAARGEVDLAVGNIFGSNVFNMLGVLGLTCVVQPQNVPQQILLLDAPAMLLVSVAMIPIVRSGARISRLEGWLLVFGYAAYTTILITAAPRWFHG